MALPATHSSVRGESLQQYLPTLLNEAKSRWLKAYEILQILQNHQICKDKLPVQTETACKPQSGALYLYDKTKARFRYDGINWKKKKGRQVQLENHVKLKVGGVQVIKCFYTRSADDENFHRRCYSLIEPLGNELVEKPNISLILVHYLRKETQRKNITKDSIEIQYKPQPENSPESNNEDSSLQMENANNNTTVSYEIPSPPPIEQFLASLGETSWGSSGTHMEDINQINQLHSSMYRTENQHFYQSTNVPPPMFDYLSNPGIPLGWNEKQPELSTVHQLTHLVEISPSWDWEEGGTTVLLIFPQPFSSNTLFSVNFGNAQVSGDFITPTVLRCKSPPRDAGIYSIAVYWNQMHQVSHEIDFEYKRNITKNTTELSEALQIPEMSFRYKILERIESIEREIKSTNGEKSGNGNNNFFNISDTQQNATVQHRNIRRYNAQKVQERRKAARTIALAWRNYQVNKRP